MTTALLAVLVVLGEWTGLARAALGLPIYAAALDLALLGLVGWTIARAWPQRHGWRIQLLDVLIGGYFVLAAIQILNPNVPSPIVGLEGFRKTAFTMLGYVVVRLAVDRDGLRFLYVFALGSLPALVWAIRQSVAVLPIELDIITSSGSSPISFHSGQFLRAFAPTAGPFHLGILAGSVLVVAVAFARTRSVRWVAVAVVAGVALGASITRANIVASILAIAVIVLLSPPMRERIRASALSVPAIVATFISVAIATATVPVLPNSPPQPGASQPAATPGPVIPNPLEDRSLQFRFTFWAEQLEALAERPLIGFGTSSAADGFGRRYEGTGSRNFQPHSLYLKPAMELGLGGLALFLGILAAFAIGLWQRHRSRDPVWLSAVGVFVLLLTSGLTGPMLDAYPFNLFFWALVGLVVAEPRNAAIDQDSGRPTAAEQR